jgi:hypothetical protein
MSRLAPVWGLRLHFGVLPFGQPIVFFAAAQRSTKVVLPTEGLAKVKSPELIEVQRQRSENWNR